MFLFTSLRSLSSTEENKSSNLSINLFFSSLNMLIAYSDFSSIISENEFKNFSFKYFSNAIW